MSKPKGMIDGERNQLFEACGKYSRTIEVFKGIEICFECKHKKYCLIFDSSDGEYSEVFFCLECLNGFGDGFVSNSTYNTNDLSRQDEYLEVGDKNFWICDDSVDEVYRGKDYPQSIMIRDCEDGVRIEIWTEYGAEETMKSARNLLRLLNG